MDWEDIKLFLLEFVFTLFKITILGIATLYLISLFRGVPFTWDFNEIPWVGLAVDLILLFGRLIIKGD